MADRDVERVKSKAKFVATLRRVADAIESGQAVRIQVAAKRFLVPADAQLSVEHEVSRGDEELELQLKWRSPRATATSAKKKAGKKKAGRKKAPGSK